MFIKFRYNTIYKNQTTDFFLSSISEKDHGKNQIVGCDTTF